MESLKRLPILVLALSVCVLSISFSSCKKKKLIQVDPEFSKYIDAYTSGVVSKKTSFKIQLATDAAATHTVNENIKETLFEFSPAVEGKAFWVDARTIEFKPNKDLDIDKLYEVEFKLSKVLNVPKKFKEFRFNVQTAKPSFQISDNGLRSLGKETMMLTGEIVTADVEESKKVESILSATISTSNLAIKWQHNEVNKTHSYTIENIKRTNAAGSLILKWDGATINANIKDQKEIAIPAIGDFKVMDIKVIQEQEQYALVQFSDPLMIGQQLEGLISISQQENLSYTILGSEVKVYASGKLDGGYTASVLEGIQNMWGDKLSKAFTSQIFFENRLPSVKIHGKGVILPNSGGKILLPFEATNLKAVDVSIIKVYENNIPQFFQNNKMDGDDNLRRVARPTVQATVKLDDDKSLNLHKKNRFSLDLDKYIKTEPGAIYHITIGFRPSYSMYTCTTKPDGDEESNSSDEDEYGYNRDENVDDDDAFWRRYDSYYPYGYNWDQRDNPCSKAYYNKERFASRNILATNIGLTAKRGSNNSMMVAANNIINTEPMAGVELQALDYQQQIIGKGSTNSDGIAMLELKRKPYLLVAKKGNEKSYLRLDDGNSLPLARFNIDGAQVKNGIKGFVFGERGVWRPGDSLFLGCIIEDKEKKLPAGHPVEMELISPRGQLYKRLVTPNAEDGYNVFRTATDANAPTGNWLCKVKVGGAVFEKTIKIETVMPNRLKIDLNFGDAKALGKNVTAQGTLSAKWLFGADAQNLKARVDAQLYRKNTTFEKYTDYEFDNPVSSFSSQSKTIFDGSLNEKGVAAISPQFEAGNDAPGMLLANLMVKVFEPGGNFSMDNISFPYHPYASYIGLKIPEETSGWGYLQNNKTYALQLVDVNTNGIATNGNTDVEVQLYKIQWRWWWDRSEDDFSNFTQDEYNKLIKKETHSIAAGKGVYNLKLTAADYGRYLILFKDTRSGHTTGKSFYVDDYAHQSYAEQNDASSIAMLSFTSDKAKYNVGEECKLTVPSPANGRMLVSIETGTKVLQTKWVNTSKGETKYSFKIDKTMTPNIYVNISMLQPHAQTLNDLPIRMYGVIPVEVEDKNTILNPVIKMNDVIRPEEKTSIIVSEQNGKSMTYCIAIVDEGLLDLTHFKTPNPHSAFYAKEALGVKSWDVYDYVIGAWGGQLERILTIGGDAEGDDAAKTRRANRFRPVVQYYGPFRTNGSSKTHNFTLPNYMGSVRAMVIAAGNGAYGATEKSVKVRKPLMLLATMPRVLGPGEDLKIPVTVFATENNIKNVNISIQSNPMIEVPAGNTNIKFAATGEQVVYINAKVKNATGIGKVKVVASSGNTSAYHEIEIDVRNPNPYITQVSEYTLQAGQSMNAAVATIGDASSKATVEISSIPAINLQKRLSYLIQYPHGCIEQTTSSVFPQLALNSLMDLNDKQKADIDKNIKAAIQKIQNFQTSDGGFSYWPGNMDADEWGTNYAGHFLLEASAKGFNVSSSMLGSWKAYQRNKANAWSISAAPWYGTDLTQAYRLYLLALAKAPEQGAMNRLRESKFISAEAKWRLAAAYYLCGQTQVANSLITGLPTTFTQRPYWGMSYGSDVRDDAMVLEALTLIKRRGEAEQLVRTIASKLSQETWYSTQTTAYSLIAIAKYCGDNGGQKINANGTAGTTNINVNSNSSIAQQMVGWQNGKALVKLTNKGSNVLYVRLINQGQPIGMNPVAYKNNPNVLQLSVIYLNTSGVPIDVSKLKQGTDFVAKVVITNPGTRGAYSQMALSQVFPSGWEILNTRMYNSEGAFQSSRSDYMDIRDDRVYQYFSINSKETLTYYVQLNAAYLGKYYLPGVYCEAMYDNTISAGSTGKVVEVDQ